MVAIVASRPEQNSRGDEHGTSAGTLTMTSTDAARRQLTTTFLNIDVTRQIRGRREGTETGCEASLQPENVIS